MSRSLERALDRPIAFHRVFRDISGSTTAALLLSQAWYWSSRLPENREGWFYKSQAEWQEETGLSRREQETARKQLKRVGILEEELRGAPAKLWFWVNRDRVYELIEELDRDCTTKNGGKRQTEPSSMAESANQGCTKAPTSHTETTTETTHSANADGVPLDQGQAEPQGDDQVAGNPDAEKPTPFAMAAAIFAEAGVEITTLGSRAMGKQLATAKRLIQDGVTVQDAVDVARWLLNDEFWRSRGVDVLRVEQKRVDYLTAIAATQARPVDTQPRSGNRPAENLPPVVMQPGETRMAAMHRTARETVQARFTPDRIAEVLAEQGKPLTPEQQAAIDAGEKHGTILTQAQRDALNQRFRREVDALVGTNFGLVP